MLSKVASRAISWVFCMTQLGIKLWSPEPLVNTQLIRPIDALKNIKVKVRSPYGDSDFFDNVGDVLQGDSLAPYLFIICLDYVRVTGVDRFIERKWLYFGQSKKQTIPRRNYYRHRLRWRHILTQAKSLLHNLEQAAGGIGLHVKKRQNRLHVF